MKAYFIGGIMVFSSITFIYYFLPVVLFLYYLTPSKFKNLTLLLSSLFFYFYGEPKYILVLLFSCFSNYLLAKLMSKSPKKSHQNLYLILAIIIDLGCLCYFKYTNFFLDNLNNLLNINIPFLNVIMPIGISFFTFQTLSYVIDVYNKKVEASKSFISFASYVSLFPQLIAGPIVRYSDITKELEKKDLSFDNFGLGVRRFITGLSKKVLVANVIGEMINILTDIPNPSVVSYIMIAFGYSLQIYFDFSGYSDMAIGLGKMLGFNFLENFNYPFIAKSITDFWRRWHISLSSFLRDYVYIPLGGNRVSQLKHIRNIFVVWLLTGFWHGAAWNFIIWGLYFGVILIIEKYFFSKFLNNHPVIGHIYTIILVLISFLIFSLPSMSDTFIFLKNMLGFTDIPFINSETIYYLKSYLIIIIIALIGSTPIIKTTYNKLINNNKYRLVLELGEVIICFTLLLTVTAYLIDSSFNPFLYFRF